LLYVSIYNKTVITWSDFDHSSSICIEQITLVQYSSIKYRGNQTEMQFTLPKNYQGKNSYTPISLQINFKVSNYFLVKYTDSL